METPVFTKREPRPYDYQEMTWSKFIKLREWAKIASQEIGYPIYLVGSTLYKEKPRDFDIVIVIPLEEFETKFGKLNENNWKEVLVNASNCYYKEHFSCEESLGEWGYVPLDFKVYPDNWFVNNDKLLIGEPKEINKRED